MTNASLIKYTASAGSGKTHTLTRDYLSYLFVNHKAYKNILAVTFTNKAASEMKHRILDELLSIANGVDSPMLKDIKSMLGDKARNKDFKRSAKEILCGILSDYSHFSVGTIDSFFQKVFRAFTKEIKTQSNFTLYIDHSVILNDTIEDLLNRLDENEELRRWIVLYVETLVEEGRRININEKIINISENIFKEQYKLLRDDSKEKMSEKSTVTSLINDLKAIIQNFRDKFKSLANEGLKIINENGVDDTDIIQGSKGIPPFLRKATSEDGVIAISETVRKIVREDKWFSGKQMPTALASALNAGLKEAMERLIAYYDDGYQMYKTAIIVLEQIHLTAILNDVHSALEERMREENSIVNSNIGELLMKIIGEDQTPFIYEKIGSVYNVYMIDEFQDTSKIQYNNFKPLLENSLDSSNNCMVVGDVKQSIYRWRNSDWQILGECVDKDFQRNGVTSEELSVNRRSLPAIVKFNNSIFSVLPEILDNQRDGDSPFTFATIYKNSTQSFIDKGEEGYVKMTVIASDKDFKDNALQEIPKIIMECQDDGYAASEIGILVRKNSEGAEIMTYLSSFIESNPSLAKKYNFEVISDDTLIVGNSLSVRFIIAVMKRLVDADDALNRFEMLHYYLEVKGRDQILDLDYTEDISDLERRYYPEGYERILKSVSGKTLYELSESIISFFTINKGDADVASLFYFQDQVLDYMNKKGSDIRSFTEWWLEIGAQKAVTLSGDHDALSIMTIHKAKGLEFKVVIMPFVGWDFNPSSDTIWVESEIEPFNKIGAFAVDCKSDLKDTFFAKYYAFEKASSYLDNLNILYVAFTRAKERLYGIAKKQNRANTAGDILNVGLTTDKQSTDKSYNLKEFMNVETGVFEVGSRTKRSVDRVEGETICSEYGTVRDSQRLRLKFNGETLLNNDGEGVVSKMNYGTVLHSILSRIKDKGDVKTSLDIARNEGYVSDDEYQTILQKLEGMISNEKASDWFKEGATVKTEQEILNRHGEIRRPDRLIIDGDKVTVVDYKFGEERGQYVDQIREYRALLLQMGYAAVDAYLWYVEKDKIEQV